jgi:hypothetical protein
MAHFWCLKSTSGAVELPWPCLHVGPQQSWRYRVKITEFAITRFHTMTSMKTSDPATQANGSLTVYLSQTSVQFEMA